MKICILVHDLIPYSLKASAKMIYDLAVEASSQGHEVTVILPSPDIESSFEYVIKGNIRILRFKCGKFENQNKIKRTINESLLSYYAWSRLKNEFKKNRHDYIIYYSPTIFWGLLVRKLKNLWNVKSYLILRDFFPQWLIDNGMLTSNSIITKYFLFFEKLNYHEADTIGIQSPKNLDWFLKNKICDAKKEILYNWSKEITLDSIKSIDFRKRNKLENKILMIYGGNMGPAQDMINIIELAKRLKSHKNYHLVLVGSGYEVDLVKDSISKFELDNTTYLEPIENDKYLSLLSESDIGLFSLNRSHKTHNFPGKVIGYLSMGIPILGVVNPKNDLLDLINLSNSGYISIAGNHDEFYENALKLENNQQRISMSKNAKKLMKDIFSVNNALNSILKYK